MNIAITAMSEEQGMIIARKHAESKSLEAHFDIIDRPISGEDRGATTNRRQQ